MQDSMTYMLSFAPLGALLAMLSNLALHWQKKDQKASAWTSSKMVLNLKISYSDSRGVKAELYNHSSPYWTLWCIILGH